MAFAIPVLTSLVRAAMSCANQIVVISRLSIASSQVRLALLSRQQPLMRHAILVSLGPIAHRHLILPS